MDDNKKELNEIVQNAEELPSQLLESLAAVPMFGVLGVLVTC